MPGKFYGQRILKATVHGGTKNWTFAKNEDSRPK